MVSDSLSNLGKAKEILEITTKATAGDIWLDLNETWASSHHDLLAHLIADNERHARHS